METVQGVKQSLNWLKNWSVHHQNYPFGWLRMLSFLVFPAYDSLLLLIQIKSLSRWDEMLYLIGEKKSHISTKTEKLEVAPIPTDVKSCERLMGAVWQRWGTAGWFSALVWLLQFMGNRDLCAPGKQLSELLWRNTKLIGQLFPPPHWDSLPDFEVF